MAKPRTNADAAEYWAQSICEREPRDYLTVNSIIVERDVVYSFGRHFPMGVIQRRSDGRVKRVVLNSDSYGSRGWANTPGDQWNVKLAARDYAAKARVPVVEQLLSAYRTGGRIQCRPKPEDPEPEAYPRTEVPPYFHARHPGDEPVHDRTNCIAGRVEAYEYQEDEYLLSNLELYADDQTYTMRGYSTPRPGDFLYRKYGASGTGGSIYARRMHTGHIVVGGKQHEYQHFQEHPRPANVTYKQCPCCYAHMTAHHRWHVYMHGGYELGHGGYKKGWLRHEALMREHGGEEGWREARRQDLRRVREARKVRAAWEERNFMPFDCVPTKRGIPVLDADGYPLRKHSEAYFRRQRELERQERQRQRELERLHRERIQVEKFKARVERIRAEKRARTFEGAAHNVAITLANLRTNGSSS